VTSETRYLMCEMVCVSPLKHKKYMFYTAATEMLVTLSPCHRTGAAYA